VLHRRGDLSILALWRRGGNDHGLNGGGGRRRRIVKRIQKIVEVIDGLIEKG